jgi:hypothetical protein
MTIALPFISGEANATTRRQRIAFPTRFIVSGLATRELGTDVRVFDAHG